MALRSVADLHPWLLMRRGDDYDSYVRLTKYLFLKHSNKCFGKNEQFLVRARLFMNNPIAMTPPHTHDGQAPFF
jgi:hypothetical protein